MKGGQRMNVIKEEFQSIHQMISVIEGRKNNPVMRNANSSKTGSFDFTMTHSYDEAKQIFQTGYTDVLDKIKSGVANFEKIQVAQRRMVRTDVMGYAPHVPNAILGLPNSMIRTDQKAQKVKTVSIVIGITENCDKKASEFVKSGIAALSVVNTLERQGYRVALKVSFWCAEAGSDRAFGTIKLKDYREHLDIKKLCFPLVHPSMFRRFGFRWLETCPQIKSSEWEYGYGHQLNDMDFIKKNFLGENEFLINLSTTKKAEYDPNRIIDQLNLN